MTGETLCPVTKTGLHQKRPWQDVKAGRSGLSCQACHKTWEHLAGYPAPVATYCIPFLQKENPHG